MVVMGDATYAVGDVIEEDQSYQSKHYPTYPTEIRCQ